MGMGAMIRWGRQTRYILTLALVACGGASGSDEGSSDSEGTTEARQQRAQPGAVCRFEGPYTMSSDLSRAYLTGGGVYQGCAHGARPRTAVIQTTDEDACTAVACVGDTCVELECDPAAPVGICTGTETETYSARELGDGIDAFCEYTWSMTRGE